MVTVITGGWLSSIGDVELDGKTLKTLDGQGHDHLSVQFGIKKEDLSFSDDVRDR